MKIAIGSDHAGVELKNKIKEKLKKFGEVIDCGTNSSDSVDYPDYASKVAQEIISGKAVKGVLICGSGIGMCIAANRHKGIRAALCHNSETAKLSRQHNDANILVLGARTVDESNNLQAVEAFFTTDFEGGRHQRRVEKMSK